MTFLCRRARAWSCGDVSKAVSSRVWRAVVVASTRAEGFALTVRGSRDPAGAWARGGGTDEGVSWPPNVLGDTDCAE